MHRAKKVYILVIVVMMLPLLGCKSKKESKWPDSPDLKHFEESVLSMEFVKKDSFTMADYMPGLLFSKVTVGPGLNEVFISVVYAAPFESLANSNIPAVQRRYRQLFVLPIAKQFNMYMGKSVKRPFQVTFYFLETLPVDAYKYVNPRVLSVDRVWLLRFPSSFQDAQSDDAVQ